MIVVVVFFFFFFQAEDGIRDLTVTGVQTCALPIYPIGKQDQYAAAFGGLNVFRFRPGGTVTVEHQFLSNGRQNELFASMMLRSEERRVGKECRSRWSPYH